MFNVSKGCTLITDSKVITVVRKYGRDSRVCIEKGQGGGEFMYLVFFRRVQLCLPGRPVDLRNSLEHNILRRLNQYFGKVLARGYHVHRCFV